MECTLRCNDLKCRAQLQDQAVVTTCSHVFCSQCAEITGLSRSSNANRSCPACGTQLINPNDAVVAGLNPSEDYKTSVLSGLNPTIIMECASRGLAFYSYQTSQEIIYQEHLAKSLTEKYTHLSAQMDQLINDANTQIKALQDKMQGMQVEQASLEQKNHELIDAFRDKSKAQAHIQKLYQSLKAQVMATHVANAAGDEVDLALHSTRGDRFVDRLPGARMGSANAGQMSAGQLHGNVRHHRNQGESASSGDSGQQRGGIGLASSWNSQLSGHILSSRRQTGSAPGGTLRTQTHRSRLPILGGTRQNATINADAGPYQSSPRIRQSLGGDIGPKDMGSFGIGSKSRKSSGIGHLRR